MEKHLIEKNNSFSDKVELKDCHYGEYYSYEDIIKHYPEFNKAYPGRKVLQKYKFSNEDYAFIIKSQSNYKFYGENYNKAKIFFKKSCIDRLIGNLNQEINNLPPLLNLKELPEFFQNGKNKLIFRGDKTKEQFYVSVESVAKLFEINASILKKNIINGDYSLKLNDHYKIFEKLNGSGKLIKLPYFTYCGFIAYLFISKATLALKINSFCECVLFSSMFGTVDEKKDIIENKISRNPDELNEIRKKLGPDIKAFNLSVSSFGKISCLYLLILEKRKSTYIVKFGRTEDLKRRLNDHLKDFGNVNVKICRMIDDTNLIAAEQDLYDYFKAFKKIDIWPENSGTIRKEVFEVKKSDINDIKKIYNKLSSNYGTKVVELNKNFKILEKCSELEKKDIQHFYELKLKDLEHSLALKDKEIELLNFKLKVLEA